MRTFFSIHALERVDGRISLTEEEIGTLLRYDLVVPIGRENGTTRVHRLFYSAPDQQCFIAVQDEVNGEVVTILPLDYAPWKVSLEAQQAAEVLTRERPITAEETTDANASPEETEGADTSPASPVHFIFLAVLRLPDGSLSIRKLGKIEAASYAFDPARILEDVNIGKCIREWARALEEEESGARVISCAMRLGNKGQPRSYPYVVSPY